MKVPSDGWDEDEREIPDALARELSNMRGAAALPLDVLRAAGTGVLPDDLEQAAQAYLAREPDARALVDELNNAATLDPHGQSRLYARLERETRTPHPSRSGSRWQWPAAAAIGAIAVAGSLWLTLGRDSTEAPAVTVTQSTPSPPATPTPAPASQPETFLLPLERPGVRVSLRALTWRGSERTNPALAALKPALDAFRAGDYRLADREFSAIAGRYPDLIEVPLYQGVSRLFLGDVAGATTSLRSAEKIGDEAFRNDVSWYLAIAEERSGNVTAARTRLAALCPNGKSGDPRACAVLAKQ